MAALLLAWATGSSTLYKDAEDYYTKYELANSIRVFNWDSKTPGLVVLFAQVNQASPSLGGNFTVWQDRAENYFDDLVDKKGPGYLSQGEFRASGPKTLILLYGIIDGLLFFDGDSDDASLNPALNTAMLLERFVPMASNAEKKVAYQVRFGHLRRSNQSSSIYPRHRTLPNGKLTTFSGKILCLVDHILFF